MWRTYGTQGREQRFLPIFGPDGAALQADIRPFSGIAIERQVLIKIKALQSPPPLMVRKLQ